MTIAGGVVLRLVFLGADSFWLDEAYSVTHVVGRSASEIWHTSVDPNHPSLYFIILWFVLRVGGVSEAVARLPSAIASILSLALVYVLSRRLGLSTRAACVAVLLMAYAPLDLWYAQEARMYAMVTLAALSFAVGITGHSWPSAICAVVALILGLYVDFTMVALWAVLSSLWVARWWFRDRRLSSLASVIGISAVAWLVYLPEWSHLGEVIRRIDTVPLLVNLRRQFGVHVAPGFPAIASVSIIAVIVAALAAIVWSSLRIYRVRNLFGWVLWAGFVAATIGFAIPRGYSAKQFLATGWPFVALVLAWALTDALAATHPWATWRLPIAIASSFVAALITVSTPRADWRSVVAYLNQRSSRTAGVWVDHPWNTIPYDFYNPVLVAGTDIAQSTASANGRLGNLRDVCLVAERSGGDPPTTPAESWFDAHFTLAERISFARLEVRCYSTARGL